MDSGGLKQQELAQLKAELAKLQSAQAVPAAPVL